MKLLSNLIKSRFVAFSQDNKLVIDANQNKIIKAINSGAEEFTPQGESLEEAVAEAMIRDAELDGVDFDGDILTVDTEQLSNPDDENGDLSKITAKVLNSAKQEAEDIVNRAHDEAEQTRAEAYENAIQIKENANQEGYEAGYREGMEKAQAEISLQKEELDQLKQSLLDETEEFRNSLVKETEHKMVDILCGLVQSVTGVVVEDQRDVLLFMINKAMQNQDDSKHYIIKLSKEDYSQINDKKMDIYGAFNPNIDIELFEDAKLEKSQCIIEMDHGILDLSLDVQMDNLITALKLMIKD